MTLVQFDPAILEMVTVATDDADQAFEFINELLGIFRSGTAKTLIELYDHLDDGQVKEAGDTAHRLKSSCLALGFIGLAQACGDIEKQAHDGASAVDIELKVGEIEDALPVSIAQLELYIQTSGAHRQAS